MVHHINLTYTADRKLTTLGEFRVDDSTSILRRFCFRFCRGVPGSWELDSRAILVNRSESSIRVVPAPEEGRVSLFTESSFRFVARYLPITKC